VIPSAKQPFIAVDKYFLLDLMMPLLEKVKVDEDWYLKTYPDVHAAIRGGVVADAKAHFCRFGYYEHRMPHPILVDEAWYLNEYPDVQGAVTAKTFASGQAHFEELGYKEGRFPYAGFRFDERSPVPA
jgi:hypothetical protein